MERLVWWKMTCGNIKCLIPGHKVLRVSPVLSILSSCLIHSSYQAFFFFFFFLSWLDLGWSLVPECILANLYLRRFSSLVITKNIVKKLSADTFFLHACMPLFPEKELLGQQICKSERLLMYVVKLPFERKAVQSIFPPGVSMFLFPYNNTE